MSVPRTSDATFGSGALPLRRSRLAFWLGALFFLLVALHAPLLRLPYYWDEAGYFVPAALDILRHGWWVPRSTLPNGHPPLLMAGLAVVWKLFGFSPLVTRTAMLACATVLLWGLCRLAAIAIGESAGHWAVLLYALTPLFFAQSSLAQLDLPATLFVLWALVFRWRGQPRAYAVAAAAACLSKDTALIAFFALALVDLVKLVRDSARPREWVLRLAPHLVPAVALAAWYGYYHSVTGYWVGNPQYLAYNVGEAAFSLPRILMSLVRRLWQLAGYNGTWLLSLLALASWWRQRRSGQAIAAPHHRDEILAVLAAYIIFHSIVGGAVLARYLLPALALYVVLLTPYLLRLAPARPAAVLLPAALFLVLNWFWNPPYPFPYEDNLAYATFIQLHQQAARYLEQHPPDGAVLTAWPATGELNDPDLGYVSRPLPVTQVDDFTPRSLQPVERAAAPPAAVLLYSREYRPNLDLATVFPFWQHWTDRYFHHEAPQSGAVLLRRLGLHRVFYASRNGQWIEIAEPAHLPPLKFSRQ